MKRMQKTSRLKHGRHKYKGTIEEQKTLISVGQMLAANMPMRGRVIFWNPKDAVGTEMKPPATGRAHRWVLVCRNVITLSMPVIAVPMNTFRSESDVGASDIDVNDEAEWPTGIHVVIRCGLLRAIDRSVRNVSFFNQDNASTFVGDSLMTKIEAKLIEVLGMDGTWVRKPKNSS
jgi:hypothetical protein